jgi:hypothetical protein
MHGMSLITQALGDNHRKATATSDQTNRRRRGRRVGENDDRFGHRSVAVFDTENGSESGVGEHQPSHGSGNNTRRSASGQVSLDGSQPFLTKTNQILSIASSSLLFVPMTDFMEMLTPESRDGDRFEASNLPDAQRTDANKVDPPMPIPSNRWLGVFFRCAGQYVRVYRRPEACHYQARCPKCAQTIQFEVDPRSGSTQRLFTVSC